MTSIHVEINFVYLVRWMDKNSYGEDVEKRMVSFPAGVKYDPRLVATEWFRWLQKTRHDPPTPEELQQCVFPCFSLSSENATERLWQRHKSRPEVKQCAVP